MKSLRFSPLNQYRSSVLAALLALAFTLPVQADPVNYPAIGVYNGFLAQTNIVECDNNNPELVSGTLTIYSGAGEELARRDFILQPQGSAHLILNDITNIIDQYGTYAINLTASSSLTKRVSCRTVFYKNAPSGSEKDFDFSYVVPVRNPNSGVQTGIFNSISPGAGSSPVQNWLSVLNSSLESFTATLEVYSPDGTLRSELEINSLEPLARIDIPLGHPDGQTTGLYKIRPAQSGQQDQAFLIRYGPHPTPGRFAFAFPLRSLAGSCQGGRIFASSMGSLFTKNWLELANVNVLSVTLQVLVKDRFGHLLREETVDIPGLRQNHIFLNEIIDPQGQGNVGTVEVRCSSPDDLVLAQSAYYGSHNSVDTSWAYAAQSTPNDMASQGFQLSFPLNTFLGTGNWIKVAEEEGKSAKLDFSIFNSEGKLQSISFEDISASGTLDFSSHTRVRSNMVGNTTVSTDEDTSITGHVLRVLPEHNGKIGSIAYIPATIQPKLESGPNPDPDLCSIGITSTAEVPIPRIGKPDYLIPFVDPIFGARVTRITSGNSGEVRKPLYSTIQAWNADESLILLYRAGEGGGYHFLIDGQTYQPVKDLDIYPSDIEEVFWSYDDPDLFYYVSRASADYGEFKRYNVSSGISTKITDFKTVCGGGLPVAGSDVHMHSFDDDLFGFRCMNDSNQPLMFSYRISTNELKSSPIGPGTQWDSYTAPMPGPSGNRFWYQGLILGTDLSTVLGELDLSNSGEHSDIGLTHNGQDALYQTVFDSSPLGCDGDPDRGVGHLVEHNLETGACRSIISVSRGYPYTTSATHVSANSYHRPGWVALSSVGREDQFTYFFNSTPAPALLSEIYLASTNPDIPTVCRLAHHRSYGKLAKNGGYAPYFGEPHVTISPSGTRILFGSDWYDSGSVDTYVIELPGFQSGS